VAQRHAGRFPEIRLLTVQDLGGWTQVQQTHFAEGGVFDGLLSNRTR
jgi:sulfate transport system substrate-binding protein